MKFGAFLGVGALALGGTMLATHRIIRSRFKRGKYPEHPTADYYYEQYQTRYPRKKISFFSGKNRLQGYIYGDGNQKGLLVFAHGIGTGHEGYMQEILWMVDHGWCVFTYDATGSCESEGKSTKGLVQSALDLHAALTYIESHPAFHALPIVLMGHSWGGYAVAAVLNFDHRVSASVSIAGYANPLEMMMEFSKNTMGKATSLLRPFAALENLLLFGKHANLDAVKGINKVPVPVLLIHGTKDEVVPIDSASIVSHRSQITNPKVEEKILTNDGQNKHVDIFLNADSVEYAKEVHERYMDLYRKYQKQIPTEVLAAFYEDLDRDLINTPNNDLMESIDRFLLKSISAQS